MIRSTTGSLASVLAAKLAPEELADGKRMFEASSVIKKKEIHRPLCPREPISLALTKSTPLPELLRTFEVMTGLGVKAPPRADFRDLRVTVKFDDIPWEDALTEVLERYGYSWVREGDVIRVVALEAPHS